MTLNSAKIETLSQTVKIQLALSTEETVEFEAALRYYWGATCDAETVEVFAYASACALIDAHRRKETLTLPMMLSGKVH